MRPGRRSGSRDVCAAGDPARRGGGVPPSPVRPAERPVHSQPCRCARSVCWEQARSAAWPMPFRPGIPPRLRSVPRAPPAHGPEGLPHQRVNLRTTWPEAHEPTGRVLRPTRHEETVCPDAARRRGADAEDGAETLSCPTGGMLEGGQPVRLGNQRDHQPTRPHRHSHSPSNLKVRPPTGGPALVPAGPPRGRPGGVHVRCRWRG